jgi:hypothetical protein
LAGLAPMAAGILGSALAWDYWALLVCRLVTGVGAAMIPPNSMAAIADHFPPAQRGTPISILISVSFFGVAIGTPAVAYLVELGGWRLPFYVAGVLLVMVWGLQWYWFPQRTQVARTLSFFAHFKEAGRSVDLWYVLVANFFYQTAALGIFVYLVAFLIRTYGMQQGDTPLPLAVVGIGAMLGSLIGGYVSRPALSTDLGSVCPPARRRLRRRSPHRQSFSLDGGHFVLRQCPAPNNLRTGYLGAGGGVRRGSAGDRQWPSGHQQPARNYWRSVGRRDCPRPGRFPTGRALLHGCCSRGRCDRDSAQIPDRPDSAGRGKSRVNARSSGRHNEKPGLIGDCTVEG